jgi:hypothetical protein
MKPLKDFLMPALIVALGAIVVLDHASPRRPPASPAVPAVSGQALGAVYAPMLVASYSDAWMAAARTLEEGKPVALAQQTLQETWKGARAKAFTEHVTPSFSLVLPEGTEPATDQQRAQVVALWRGFARGLKGDR